DVVLVQALEQAVEDLGPLFGRDRRIGLVLLDEDLGRPAAGGRQAGERQQRGQRAKGEDSQGGGSGHNKILRGFRAITASPPRRGACPARGRPTVTPTGLSG